MPAAEIGPQPAGTFWMLNLQGPLPALLKPGLAAVFARLSSEAAFPLSHAMGLDNPKPVLERFAAARRCYGAWVDGMVAAYGWVTFDEEEIGELGLRIRMASGEAYIWDCATLPAYRGQRLYPALLGHICGELRAEGFRLALIGADSDNLASQKGMMLAGFQPVADMLLVPDQAKRLLCLSGRPGVSEQLVQHIRRSLVNHESRLL